MKRGSLITSIVVIGLIGAGQIGSNAQQPANGAEMPPVATFKASVDLVRVSAVVRDKKGRFVHDLTARDFEITDGGIRRPISDFRHEDTGVSVAMLFDVSGSMELTMPQAREAAKQVLSWLTREEDEAAIYTFDTRLDEVTPFTSRLSTLPDKLAAVRPFGATSLHDAIARTAEKVATREVLRRAVVVFTDGLDNASRLTPGEVSGIASAIDVPVYIVGVVSPVDDPAAPTSVVSPERSVFTGSLHDLATWTGGRTFVVSSIAQRSLVARQIVDELRHQYLIAFESSQTPGWHPLVVRARDKDLTVRARSGYIAGQSRPVSH
ncbi:MAG TPA: VWA domain-containing protein [Vicinamibacterales bacterium]|jgi:Ca-activated chloride channel family protein